MTRRMCPFCRQMTRVINKINLNLPIGKKIQIIDCWEYEENNLDIKLIEKLNNSGLKEGYPFLYIDGIIVDSAPTEEQLRIFLEEFLNEDLIV